MREGERNSITWRISWRDGNGYGSYYATATGKPREKEVHRWRSDPVCAVIALVDPFVVLSSIIKHGRVRGSRDVAVIKWDRSPEGHKSGGTTRT